MTGLTDTSGPVAIDQREEGSGAAVEPGAPRRTIRWIALVVAVAVAVLVAVLATRDAAVNRLSDSPLLGKPAPELSGRSVLAGGTTDLADLRGQYVVVNFFASWCVPCQREHPELERFQNRHRAAGDASVLAVLYDDSPAAARKYFAENGGDWPVVDDPDGKVALDWGVRGPPESFLVDPDGFVLYKITGEVDFDGLEQLLRQAKAGRG